ncbi:MAG: tetratricopeptide repeat protein [candidate division KSB1 bacterium]|nr:tetratricopeptide repeat protein [candidate division KSB1 bacterium]
MLKARKKITKRQIKEDKLVTYYFKTIDFFNRNSKYVTIGLTAIVVVLILVTLFRRAKQRAELEASAQLTKALAEIGQNNLSQATDILVSLAEKYSGTSSAESGVYLLAHTYYQKGDFEQAKVYFEKYINDYRKNPILSSAAYAGLGASLEQQKKYLEAAQAYEKGATKFASDSNAPQQLFNAARCYMLANRNDKAKLCLEKIIENYSNSSLKNDAEFYLAKLTS